MTEPKTLGMIGGGGMMPVEIISHCNRNNQNKIFAGDVQIFQRL